MKFIDKSANKAIGNNLINAFLDSRWSAVTNTYTRIQYDQQEFRNNVKPHLKKLLIAEQQNLCCYCMRRLENNETTTLEHVIPQSTLLQADLAKYTTIQLIRDNVTLQSVFETANVKLITPPFPHTIAYENLTASCDGRIVDGIPKNTTAKFCNNKRGKEDIIPLFYISDIEGKIEYKKGGTLVPTDISFLDTIHNLQLNYQSLEKIRRVWFHISVEELDVIEQASNENDRNIILSSNLASITPLAVSNALIADFKTETFWRILLQYKWFYAYYRNKYHNNN